MDEKEKILDEKLNINIIEESYKLLSELKLNKSNSLINEIIEYFNSIFWEDIKDDLVKDQEKMTFWINMYNSLTLILIRNEKNRKLYPNSEFFNIECFNLKNLSLTLNDIEHKILRSSKILYCLGYINRCCVPIWEQYLRVRELDFRIHFALNCGAKSCPPIKFYKVDQLDKQLDLATKNFLSNTSKFNIQENKLYVSEIFLWFKGDFSKLGAIEIHRKYTNFEINDKTSFSYTDYDWSIEEKYSD